jgi:hypothetical protein
MCLPINRNLKIQKRSGGERLKKKALAFAVLIVATMVLISMALNVRTVKASNGSDYDVEHVEHTVKVLYDGYIFINDTIQITGQASNGFLMGFPYEYGPYVIRCVAYNSSDIFPVSLDVPLKDHIGFYGIRVDFNETPGVFTVGFLLSNKLLTAVNATIFTLDFPAYPSFPEQVAINASVSVKGATYINGTMGSFTYGEESLPAFSSIPANVTFKVTSSQIQLSNIDVFNSEITINQLGGISGVDTYYVTNTAPTQMSSIEVSLPPNAFNPNATDQFGRTMLGSGWVNKTTHYYNVSFAVQVASNSSVWFSVKYSLPSNYSTQIDSTDVDFKFPLFQGVDYYIERASVTFVLPEGASISDFKNTLAGSLYDISKNVFQESLVISGENVSYLENVLPSENVLQLTYQYNPLWSSFLPTLWMWALAIVGCAFVVVWKRPRAPAPVVVPTMGARVRAEDIRSFIDLYEEKRKVTLESESLETMVQKGRIPRRRYKVRKKTLEMRLGTLSRNLEEFTERMRGAGGKYADLMRQLEIAETEANEVEAGIKSIDARHSRGEISFETHRRLLMDYKSRKDKTERTINGILLRLREEIR